MKRLLISAMLILCGQIVSAQSMQEKAGINLKTVLFNVIKNHTNVGYDGLWDAYETTDVRSDGKIWDMYSNISNFNPSVHGGSYKGEGDAMNREHTVPQSWFNEASPMKADLFQVYPVDGWVNGMRSNYPYGEVGTAEKQSAGGFSKLGKCVTPGYSGTVFEPADEYKGDLARTYFYMATCYQDKVNGWSGGIFGNNNKYADYTGYPGMAEWQLKMLIRWSKQDPVSQKEIDRNNAVYKLQGNRNPFIDCPGLERFIWSEYIE